MCVDVGAERDGGRSAVLGGGAAPRRSRICLHECLHRGDTARLP